MHYTQHLLIDTQRYINILMHRYSICSIDMRIEPLCIAMHRSIVPSLPTPHPHSIKEKPASSQGTHSNIDECLARKIGIPCLNALTCEASSSGTRLVLGGIRKNRTVRYWSKKYVASCKLWR